MSQEELNRSGAMSPEMTAVVNTAIAEGIKAALAGFAPILKDLALTPEKPLYGHRSGKQSKTHWIAFLKPNKE